ncbi:MAG TPA: class I SAM-dependent methyltransferase [Candidatus Dormibacteraeota bacterium]|nr:class I SAM-dependent methyltransferase [Candidatus Dormibacteraeota bacterium]
MQPAEPSPMNNSTDLAPQSFRLPLVRHSDLLRAPLHDLTLRDELLGQFLPLPRDAEVLEVGPGTGFTAYWLARQVKRLTLLDVAQRSIERLKSSLSALSNVSFACADVCDPALPRIVDQTFNVAFALDVLEYVPDPAACLRNLGALLRVDGVLLLAWPNYSPARTGGITYIPHRSTLERMLREAGFKSWKISLLRLRPIPKFIYRQLHDRPLDLYRRIRKPAQNNLPQIFDETWAHQNQHVLERFRWLLNSYWAIISSVMLTAGDCFECFAPAGDNIEGRALVIARR